MTEEMKFKSFPLWEYTEKIELQPTESTTITVPSTIKSAAKALYFTQGLLKNGASEYQYNIKSTIKCKIKYKSEKINNDNFTVLFNRDIEEESGYFTNSAVLDLQGYDIETITLTITNHHTTELLTIRNLGLYESDDIKVTTIAKVLKEETISADLIMATSVFTDALFTQILQTNTMSRSVKVAKPNDVVDFIQAEGYTLGFYTETLGTEQEQFKIQTTVAGQPVEYIYWYSQIAGEDAYKYLTTIDPRDKHPDISDSEREKFAFMVYKPISTSKKLSFEFALDENGNLTPTIIYGAGTDPSGTTNNGKGFTYKNTNGFYHIYQQSDGEVVGIVMDEDGVHIIGWADQHLENITFKDNGVKLKFTGEDEHRFEYVYDDNGTLTGLLQDAAFLTTISYEAGSV